MAFMVWRRGGAGGKEGYKSPGATPPLFVYMTFDLDLDVTGEGETGEEGKGKGGNGKMGRRGREHGRREYDGEKNIVVHGEMTRNKEGRE